MHMQFFLMRRFLDQRLKDFDHETLFNLHYALITQGKVRAFSRVCCAAR